MESGNEKIPINDLEMAKKRTNKIMITDMAIENDSNEVALTYSLDYRNFHWKT